MVKTPKVRSRDPVTGKIVWVEQAPPPTGLVVSRASSASSVPISVLSAEPPPATIDAVIRAIEVGEFQADAFAGQGIPWVTAVAWLRIGEASVKLAAEDPGRAIDWRGVLYQRVTQATAASKAPIMHKLHTQATKDGGELAIRYLKLRHGEGGGGAAGSGRAGRDYAEQEAAGGQDSLTDDDVLAMIDGAITAAQQAADARAAERIPESE